MLRTFAEAVIRSPDRRGKSRLLKFLLRCLNGTPVRSRYGPLIRVRADDYTNRSAVTGMYHADYDDVFEEVTKLRPGMAFIDVGANAGLFSMVAGERIGPNGAVIAFEPSLRVFRDLVENATLNGLRSFYPFNVAFGGSTRIARFSSGSAAHTGGGHLNGDGDIAVLQVSAGELDSMMEEIIGERSTVAKIDVEGAEELVIDSLHSWFARPQVEKVIVEIDPKHLARFGGTAETLYGKMSAMGFHGLRGIGATHHYNEIFVR